MIINHAAIRSQLLTSRAGFIAVITSPLMTAPASQTVKLFVAVPTHSKWSARLTAHYFNLEVRLPGKAHFFARLLMPFPGAILREPLTTEGAFKFLDLEMDRRVVGLEDFFSPRAPKFSITCRALETIFSVNWSIDEVKKFYFRKSIKSLNLD